MRNRGWLRGFMDRMRHFRSVPGASRLQAAGETVFDCAYGLTLVLVRELHILGSLPAMRHGLRISWQLLRVAVIATLLVCAAHGAGWL